MIYQKDIMKILDLYQKPKSEKFTEDELEIIKKHIPRGSIVAKYAIYKLKSHKNAYVAFIIDRMPNHPRKSGLDNQYEWICSRKLTDIEYEDEIQNFGCNHRKYTVYDYTGIEACILADESVGAKTPEEFIKVCMDRGYSRSVQLKMEIA